MLKNLLNHERYQSIAVLTICVGLLWFYGCESRVRSITDPSNKITRQGLEFEIDQFMMQAELRYNELDKQDEIKALIAQNAMLAAQGSAINPTGVLAVAFGIFGIGASVDNVRKRKELKDLKK